MRWASRIRELIQTGQVQGFSLAPTGESISVSEAYVDSAGTSVSSAYMAADETPADRWIEDRVTVYLRALPNAFTSSGYLTQAEARVLTLVNGLVELGVPVTRFTWEWLRDEQIGRQGGTGVIRLTLDLAE